MNITLLASSTVKKNSAPLVKSQMLSFPIAQWLHHTEYNVRPDNSISKQE